MAITQSVCLTYKEDLFNGVHQPGDTYKLALYLPSATLDKTITAYTASGEIADVGYPAGGLTLAGRTLTASADARRLTFDDPLATPVSWAARGALLYNASRSNKAICVIDFGATIISTNSDFEVLLPVDLLEIP
jgi:hypothetical protein